MAELDPGAFLALTFHERGGIMADGGHRSVLEQA